MEPLEHQLKIVSCITNGEVTSIAAPRQNGKTVAALYAALNLKGRTLFVANGSVAARCALEETVALLDGWDMKAVNTCDHRYVKFDGGTIYFTSYGRRGGRTISADMVILDDSDCVDNLELLSPAVNALIGAPRPRLVSLCIAPDNGIAKHLYEQCDSKLRWTAEGMPDVIALEKSNPALGSLIDRRHLELAEQVLTPETFRREHLGISAA